MRSYGLLIIAAASARPVAATRKVWRNHADCIGDCIVSSLECVVADSATAAIDAAFSPIQTQVAAEVKNSVGHEN